MPGLYYHTDDDSDSDDESDFEDESDTDSDKGDDDDNSDSKEEEAYETMSTIKIQHVHQKTAPRQPRETKTANRTRNKAALPNNKKEKQGKENEVP